MSHFLFVCSQNRLRSPTAEALFDGRSGVSARSAGTDRDAENPVSLDDIEWADCIFVMEERHRRWLQQRFRSVLARKKTVVLDIPDEYEYMDSTLVDLLERKMAAFLRP